MEGEYVWEMKAPKNCAQFVRALAGWLPAGSVLYFEGSGIEPTVRDFFITHPAENLLPIFHGTISPEPECFYIPATAENIDQVATFFERYASPEICDHFHAFKDTKILLQWYDAFCKEPWLVSETIDEDRIKKVSSQTGCHYQRRKRHL